MKRITIWILVGIILLDILYMIRPVYMEDPINVYSLAIKYERTPDKDSQSLPEIIFVEKLEDPIEEIEEWIPEVIYTEDEIYLLALILIAEAEGECELGQRLVVDTILNRIDSDEFPNTVHGVVYQDNAFSCINNGRIKRSIVTDESIRIVNEEIADREDSEVLYFNAKKYSAYGTPKMIVGNHHFSK